LARQDLARRRRDRHGRTRPSDRWRATPSGLPRRPTKPPLLNDATSLPPWRVLLPRLFPGSPPGCSSQSEGVPPAIEHVTPAGADAVACHTGRWWNEACETLEHLIALVDRHAREQMPERRGIVTARLS